jgi:hypothetical protein
MTNEEYDERIRERWRAGETWRKLSRAAYRRTVEEVRTIVLSTGVRLHEIPPGKAETGGVVVPRWTDADDRELARLYVARMPIDEIAERMGRTTGHVRSRVQIWAKRMMAGLEIVGVRADKPTRKQPRPVRPCMTCGSPFESDGPHNRVCAGCKTGQLSPFGGLASRETAGVRAG